MKQTAGFSLLEAVVAVAIVATAFAALAPLLLLCTTTIARSRGETQALAMALTRLEQLQALIYELPSNTLTPVTDSTTDLAPDPAARSGTGLLPVEAASAWRDTPGFADAAARDGSRVVPSSDEAILVRRWAVTSLPGPAGAERLFLQVFARERAVEAREAARASPVQRPSDVWLFSMRGRFLR